MSIAKRVIALMLVLAVPLAAVLLGAIWNVAQSNVEEQRRSLLYTARSLATAVDAQLGKYITLAETLARSPALLADDLTTFKREALNAFPNQTNAWLLVADGEGRQLVNFAAAEDQVLPRRTPEAFELQQLAASTGSTQIGGVWTGQLLKMPVAVVEVPIFKDGKPFRSLAVAIHPRGFLALLNAQDMPPGWLAGIIDQKGRFIARVPGNDRYVGELASESWRKTMGREGLFEVASLEGDTVINANAHSRLGGWTIGVSIRRAELQAGVWDAVGGALLAGGVLVIVSLLAAGAIGRSIREPVLALGRSASALLAGSDIPAERGPPEVRHVRALLQAAAQERDRAQSAADAAQAQLAEIVRSSADAIVSKTLQGIITSWNAGAERMFGYSAEEMTGQSIRKLIPADRQHEEDMILARIAVGERIEHYETKRMPKNGCLIDVSVTISPTHDADGRIIGASKIVRDVTESKRAEAALRASEERLASASRAARFGIHDMDVARGSIVWSAELVRILGLGATEREVASLEQMLDTVHSADRERVAAEIASTLRRTGPYQIEFRIARADGQVRWIVDQGEALGPIDPRTGEVARITGTVIDITERKNAEEHKTLLINELNHRVKNTLATVQAIAMQTFRRSNLGASMVDAFQARLSALAAAHDILTREHWESAGLRDLVEQTVAVHGADFGARFTIEGPNVRLPPKAALALTMGLHELCTNAAKYGALAKPGGHVRIAWQVGNGLAPARLRLRWEEHGGPPVEAPRHKGFGSRLIERVIAEDLEAEIAVNYLPEGVVCQIDAPIPEMTKGPLNPLSSRAAEGPQN